MQRKVFLSIVLLLAIMMACTVPPTQNLTSTPPPTPLEATNGTLWTRVFAPADNAIVNTQTVEVRGEAAADTVLSINDEILIVPSDQTFSVSISLEEGMNVIEIIASDYDGNEVSFILTVTYQP